MDQSKQVARSRHKKEPGILPGSTGLYLLMRSHLPIVGSAVIFVPLHLPIAILPGVITELWGVFQHLLTDVGPEAVERGVEMERAPRDWIMAMIQPHEAPEAHDRIGDAT